MTRPSAQYLRGRRINPTGITGHESAADLIDNAFFAYNAGRLREGCLLFTQRMLEPEVTVGHEPHRCDDTGGSRHEQPDSADGSRLRGLDHFHGGAISITMPTFALGLAMHQGSPHADDVELRDKGVVRIYDIFFDYSRSPLDRRIRAGGVGAGGVPAADEHGGVSLPARWLPAGAGEGSGPPAAFGAGDSSRAGGADLHQLSW